MKRIFTYFILALAACNDNTSAPAPDAANSSPIKEPPATIIKQFILDTATAIDTRQKKMDSILSSASGDSAIFTETTKLLTEPISNPNSPFRNESLYIKLLEHQVKSNWYIDAQKLVFTNRLKLIQQNRVGNAVNDFTFYAPDGKKQKLYNIKTQKLLLLFYNPECNACKETKAALIASPIITNALQNGNLKLLAIYPDPDVALWRKHLNENPSTWINGRDDNEYLWKNKIYDLRAIPTMYLLDENKKVLLKDAGIMEIEKQL